VADFPTKYVIKDWIDWVTNGSIESPKQIGFFVGWSNNQSIRFYVPWFDAKPTKPAAPWKIPDIYVLKGSFKVNKNKQKKQVNIAIKTKQPTMLFWFCDAISWTES